MCMLLDVYSKMCDKTRLEGGGEHAFRPLFKCTTPETGKVCAINARDIYFSDIDMHVCVHGGTALVYL